MNTGWWEIDIHGCYSLVKIAFAPICACKNNQRIWRHNASISRSRDVTDQLWWRHNAKSEKTVPDDNCDMSDRWLFLEKMCVKDIKLRVRNKIIHSLPWITIFGSLVMRFTNDFHSWLRHSWKSLANRLTRDPKIVIHGNSCIILYFIPVPFFVNYSTCTEIPSISMLWTFNVLICFVNGKYKAEYILTDCYLVVIAPLDYLLIFSLHSRPSSDRCFA